MNTYEQVREGTIDLTDPQEPDYLAHYDEQIKRERDEMMQDQAYIEWLNKLNKDLPF